MANFEQALKWLRQGKKVKLKPWIDNWLYVDEDFIRWRCEAMYCPCIENVNRDDWEIYEDPKPIPPPQYDPREVQLNNPLIHDQDYVVWDKKGNRTFAWWDGTDKCFYPLCGPNIFALDVVKWKKLPEKDD